MSCEVQGCHDERLRNALRIRRMGKSSCDSFNSNVSKWSLLMLFIGSDHISLVKHTVSNSHVTRRSRTTVCTHDVAKSSGFQRAALNQLVSRYVRYILII